MLVNLERAFSVSPQPLQYRLRHFLSELLYFSVLESGLLSERRYGFVELNASFRHLASCFSGDT